ncbi:hypothetical protein D3C76_1623290 [compost metagenome]
MVKFSAGQRDGQERGQRPGQHQAADLRGMHAQLILQIQHGDQADADKQAGDALINHHRRAQQRILNQAQVQQRVGNAQATAQEIGQGDRSCGQQ